MKSKKAMTPLASTVLLICFAAILGLIIMSWGASLANKIPDTCSKVSLTVSKEGEIVSVIPKINDIVCDDKKIDISNALK